MPLKAAAWGRGAFSPPLLALALSLACTAGPRFQGTLLEPPVPALAFTLEDQHGQATTLADFRGKVVVLAFMYTRCPDVCPLLASKLQGLHEALGQEAANVAFAVVSVDPEGDTKEAALEFSRHYGMERRWSYLVGGRDALTQVWSHYFVEAHQEGDAHSLIEHGAPVYLLDGRGEARMLLTLVNQDVPAMLHDILELR